MIHCLVAVAAAAIMTRKSLLGRDMILSGQKTSRRWVGLMCLVVVAGLVLAVGDYGQARDSGLEEESEEDLVEVLFKNHLDKMKLYFKNYLH